MVLEEVALVLLILIILLIIKFNNRIEVSEEQKVHHPNNHLIHLLEMMDLEILVVSAEEAGASAGAGFAAAVRPPELFRLLSSEPAVFLAGAFPEAALLRPPRGAGAELPASAPAVTGRSPVAEPESLFAEPF